MPSDEMSSRHVVEIDGLRAVAVLGVMVFHYQKSALPLGYLGVDVFFAISGYVITRSIAAQLDGGTFTYGNFFLRRLRRLFPALSLMIVATVILSALLLPRRTAILTGAPAIFGLSNIALAISGNDYFSESAEWNPLIHTWSLGVEEQFYLLFPVLLVSTSTTKRLQIGVLAAIAFGSLVAYLSMLRTQPTAVFYLPIFRIWELLFGSLTYCLRRSRASGKLLRFRSGYQYVLLAALIATTSTSSVPEPMAAVVCVGITCGLLYLSGLPGRPIFLLDNPAMQGVGAMSYSLYLWHWPVAVFSRLLMPTEWVLPIYAGGTLLTAALSHWLLEVPLRRANWSWFHNRFIVAFPLVSVAAVALLAVLWVFQPRLYLGPKSVFQGSFLIGDPCHIPGPNGLLTCLRPQARENGAVWLIGDSHAGNFLLGLRAAGTVIGFQLQHVTGRSLAFSLAGDCGRLGCPEGGHEALAARLAQVSTPGDVVILSFDRERVYGATMPADTFRTNLETFVGRLSGLGLKVVLVEDVPKVCADDGDYLKSIFRSGFCEVTMERSRLGRRNLSEIYSFIQRRHEVEILDPHDLLCDRNTKAQARCSNVLDGEVLYVDASPHLTAKQSVGFADFFIEPLRRLLVPRPAPAH